MNIRCRAPYPSILVPQGKFNSKPDMVNALLSRKIDGYVVDEPAIRAQMYINKEITYVPEYMDRAQSARSTHWDIFIKIQPICPNYHKCVGINECNEVSNWDIFA